MHDLKFLTKYGYISYLENNNSRKLYFSSELTVDNKISNSFKNQRFDQTNNLLINVSIFTIFYYKNGKLNDKDV